MRRTNEYPGISDLWKHKTKAEQAALSRQGANRYKVRFVKPGGGQGSKTVKTQTEAKNFQKQSPEEAAAQVLQTATVRDVMEQWLSTKGADLEDSTLAAYRQDVDGVLEKYGETLAAEVDDIEVIQWSVRKTPGWSKRRKQIVAMKAAFALAVRGKTPLLETNRLVELPLPPQLAKDPLYLDWDQLEDLAEAITAFDRRVPGKKYHHKNRRQVDYAPLVWVLGTCGIRLEEAARLNVDDIDRHKRTLFIRKSKTGAGRNRWVPIDPEVLAILPTAPGPVFRDVEGGRLNSHNWRERIWNPVIERLFGGTVWEDLTPHDLRHTAASLAIDSGANALKVANMLGHKNASITLKIYAHKFEATDNDVADKMYEDRQRARKERHERLQKAAEKAHVLDAGGRLEDDSATPRTTQGRLSTPTRLNSTPLDSTSEPIVRPSQKAKVASD